MKEKVRADYLDVLETKGTLVFVPNGVSMWPFIKHHRQSVIIEKLSAPIKEYDVIFYKRTSGDFVLHRVVSVDKDFFVVRGDSQQLLEKVTSDQIFGIMTAFYKGEKLISVNDEKYLKKVKRWYKNTIFTRLRIKFFYGKIKLKHVIAKVIKGA